VKEKIHMRKVLLSLLLVALAQAKLFSVAYTPHALLCYGMSASEPLTLDCSEAPLSLNAEACAFPLSVSTGRQRFSLGVSASVNGESSEIENEIFLGYDMASLMASYEWKPWEILGVSLRLGAGIGSYHRVRNALASTFASLGMKLYPSPIFSIGLSFDTRYRTDFLDFSLRLEMGAYFDKGGKP